MFFRKHDFCKPVVVRTLLLTHFRSICFRPNTFIILLLTPIIDSNYHRHHNIKYWRINSREKSLLVPNIARNQQSNDWMYQKMNHNITSAICYKTLTTIIITISLPISSTAIGLSQILQLVSVLRQFKKWWETWISRNHKAQSSSYVLTYKKSFSYAELLKEQNIFAKTDSQVTCV